MTEAPMLGDHLALDLLNTEARSDGAQRDYWQNADDVLAWLARHGLTPEGASVPDGEQLLKQAQALRTLARQLISAHKEGVRPLDIGGLNHYLAASLSAPQLVEGDDGGLVMRRVARGGTVESLLGLLAEAVAQLLAEGDFSLVRQCQHPDCVLWFYDRTKAHKRRWCSMALCGNRYKAAQFRRRNGAEG